MPMTCPSRTLLIGEYVTGQGPYVKEIMENTNVCACAVYMLLEKTTCSMDTVLSKFGREGGDSPAIWGFYSDTV